MTELTLATICSSISAVAALGSMYLAFTAIRHMEADSDANVLMRIIDLVQNEEARRSRKLIFNEDDNCKVLPEKHETELEDVCWRYDVLGMLADTVRLRNKVIQAWGPSVLKAWD